MKDDVQKSSKENRQDEKRIAEGAKRLAEEQKRKQAYLAKEAELERLSQIHSSERAKKRAAQESEQSSRDDVRKKTYLEREKSISDAEDARKLGNQHPE